MERSFPETVGRDNCKIKNLSTKSWRLNPLKQKWKKGFLLERTQWEREQTKKKGRVPIQKRKKNAELQVRVTRTVLQQDSAGKAIWNWTLNARLGREGFWTQKHLTSKQRFRNINLTMGCQVKWSWEIWRLGDQREATASANTEVWWWDGKGRWAWELWRKKPLPLHELISICCWNFLLFHKVHQICGFQRTDSFWQFLGRN